MSYLPATPAENRARLDTMVRPLAQASLGRTVFLVDGDRTLTPDDTSRTFLSRAGVDPGLIKGRFQRDGYVFEAFRFHAEVHLALGEGRFDALARDVAADTRPHPGAMEFLHHASRDAQVLVVSAGIPRIWRALLDQHDLGHVQVIGGIEPRDPIVFGRAEKGRVARLFSVMSPCVVGVGDSDVDAEMLGASHHAVVVVNHRQNADLMPHLSGHRSLRQVVPLGTPHPGIPEVSFEAIPDLDRQGTRRRREARACP